MTDVDADTVRAGHCPRCAAATVSERGALPWCGACQWQLDSFEPRRRRPEFGWRWLDRLTFRAAFRLTSRQFTALTGQPIGRAPFGPARVVVVAASVLLFAAVLALGAAGSWLIVRDFPSPTIVLGVPLLALAALLRPRFGRLDPTADRLSRAAAPTLFRLVDQVAAAVGAPAPHVIAVDTGFNAYTAAVGLRRRRVMCIGLPLWACLGPQQRVALVGHELGHFVNGDIRRSLLTQPAFTTLAQAAAATRPASGLLNILATAIAQQIQLLISRTLQALHLTLLAVALRDGQRDEYLADQLAVTAAGSTGALNLADTLVGGETLDMVVRSSARGGGGADQWRAAAQQAMTAMTPRMPALRQLSVRDEVSLFASHPPPGMRVQMIQAHGERPPTVVLTPSDTQQIDAELAPSYTRYRRDIGWPDVR